jgi:hypothetical protein
MSKASFWNLVLVPQDKKMAKFASSCRSIEGMFFKLLGAYRECFGSILGVLRERCSLKGQGAFLLTREHAPKKHSYKGVFKTCAP